MIFQKGLKRTLAIASIAAVSLTGAVAISTPAVADGANGEVRGFVWPGGNGQPNWEGTYRMPSGDEAWCASVWAPEPIHAHGYTDGGVLTRNDGSPMPVSGERSLEQLAYIVSEGSERVLGQYGQEADTYSAAVSVLVHDWTNSSPSAYNVEWPFSAFDAGTDPLGTGQQPQDVRATANLLVQEARLFSGEWKLEIGASVTEAPIGSSIDVNGVLTTAAGTPIPGKEVHLSGVGAEIPESVTTDAEGKFVFSALITGSAVEIAASRIAPADTVTMRIPTGWDGARPQNMIVVNDHSVNAALSITGSSVTLATSATDQADGDRVLPWTGGTIVDEVRYTGLTVGQEYKVTGELMDKSTGEGTGITGETTFTAESVEGTVSVTFEVPEGHAGSVLVVFERLYDASGKLQAVHEDIEDEAQTVTVEKQPVVPTKPKPSAIAHTGGPAPTPLMIAGLMVLLGAAAIGLVRRRAVNARDGLIE